MVVSGEFLTNLALERKTPTSDLYRFSIITFDEVDQKSSYLPTDNII